MSLIHRWRSAVPSATLRRHLLGTHPGPSYRDWNSVLTRAVETKCPIPAGDDYEDCHALREALLKAMPHKLRLSSAVAHDLLEGIDTHDKDVVKRQLVRFATNEETGLFREVCTDIFAKRVYHVTVFDYGRQILACIALLWLADLAG